MTDYAIVKHCKIEGLAFVLVGWGEVSGHSLMAGVWPPFVWGGVMAVSPWPWVMICSDRELWCTCVEGGGPCG